ncbi:MAG: hypothetical protein H0X24_22435 [Ktedonobacterales bacterium]|nr:hypothetical protein [Ktedonobacterales bacterium]
MQRTLTIALALWSGIALALAALLVLAHALPLQIGYYPALYLCVGLPIWRNRQRLARVLAQWQLPRLPKFLLLGYGMVLIEEIFAALFNHLTEGFSLGLYIQRVGQFWALNLFAFTGFIIGWYLLQRWLRFAFAEVFFLAGLFGLFSEHTYTFLFANPILFLILAPLNIITYGLIITPATLSMGTPARRTLHPLIRYPLALLTIFACSLIPIGVLAVLRNHFPDAFPPRKFVP